MMKKPPHQMAIIQMVHQNKKANQFLLIEIQLINFFLFFFYNVLYNTIFILNNKHDIIIMM